MTKEEREKILEFKKQQIYALLSLPPGEERLDKLAKIMAKTEEELAEEMKDSEAMKESLLEPFKYLFQREEGDKNENKKSK